MTATKKTALHRRPTPRLRRAGRMARILLVAAVAAGTAVAIFSSSEHNPARLDVEQFGAESVGTDGAVDHVEELDGDAEVGDLLQEGGGGDDGADEGVEAGGGGSDGEDFEEGAPHPEAEPEVEVPDTDDTDEAEPPAPPSLSVPASMTLGSGVYTGSFSVANVGGAALDWHAWPDPGVTVSLASGTLAGGEKVEISFSIDSSKLKTGTFERRIMIDAPDVAAKDLWVKGYKPANAMVACKPGGC